MLRASVLLPVMMAAGKMAFAVFQDALIGIAASVTVWSVEQMLRTFQLAACTVHRDARTVVRLHLHGTACLHVVRRSVYLVVETLKTCAMALHVALVEFQVRLEM